MAKKVTQIDFEIRIKIFRRQDHRGNDKPEIHYILLSPVGCVQDILSIFEGNLDQMIYF